MKSARGKNLSLVVCEDTLNTVRLDNHICISAEHIKSNLPVVVKIKRSGKNALFSTAGEAVLYPVMFTPDVKNNQIYIPPEILRDLSFKVNQKIDCVLDDINPKEWVDLSKATFVIQNIKGGPLSGNIDADDLSASLRTSFDAFGNSYPLYNGQILVLPYRDVILELRVQGVEANAVSGPKFFRITEATQIQYVNECTQRIKLNNIKKAGMVDPTVNFAELGVGGYKKEIEQLVTTIQFAQPDKKTSLLDNYGDEKHSVGILLFGPPGTGKTLMAKTAGELFAGSAVIIVNGPELKNSYYGATQQNLGDLFIEAKSNPDTLYFYIFDEIDALFTTRGSDSSVGTSNNNDLVSRFLTILDGAASLNNIVVIGTTNRKELIDPALLRAGRLDTHIYIGLPNEKDRLEILEGHTSKMDKVLASDVNLTEVAKLAKNYSGAELARVVRLARGYAKGKNYDTKDGKLLFRTDIKTVQQLEKVSQQYFLRALKDVKPMFGVDDESLQADIIFYDDNLVSIVGNFQQALQSLSSGKTFNQLNYLISGPAGTGKASLAKYLAQQSRFPHIQILTADKLVSATTGRQIEIIDEVFARARQSAEPSVIILDTIEDLIEATPDYSQYNNRLRIKFNEMLKDNGQGAAKLLVIATTKSREFLQRLGMAGNFAESESLACIHLDCGNAKKAAAQVAAIAASLGVDVQNDLSASDNHIVIEISIQDLIYQLHKHAARLAHGVSLKLSEFLHALPAEYRQVKPQLEVVPEIFEGQSSTAGLFKRYV